jgi:excisionase family DNA binding protein
MSERLLDAVELAELLHVPVRWVRESTRAGAIPHVRLGRYVRYELSEVESWLEQCRRAGRPTALRRRNPVPEGGTK